jgi:dihydropteroate synthase type 2
MRSPVTRSAPLLPAGSPRIVGIVNITADSFSDGGRYLDPAAALAQARKLRAEGADLIELGAAASHPDSAPVSAAEERRRLAPVLEQLTADGIPVSVDSFRPETLKFAACAGAACLNDIHGFGDPGLYPLLAAAQCQLIVMHAVQAAGAATRVAAGTAAVWDGILEFFTRRLAALRAAGIGTDRLVIDPGLGFFLSSTPGPSLAALAGIRELKDAFGVPVLVSPSRKSFLRAVTGRDVTQSGPATLAAEIFAAWQGADYIRTHDVAAARDALTILSAITSEVTAARLLILECLLRQRVIAGEDQRAAGAFLLLLLQRQLRSRCRVLDVDARHAAPARGDRSDGGRVALAVGDPELEIVALEQLDVDDGRGVMMDAGRLLVPGRGRRLRLVAVVGRILRAR